MALFSSTWLFPISRHCQRSPFTSSTTIAMAASAFGVRRALACLGVRLNVTKPVQPTILPSDVPIEEELVQGYDPRYFYPVNPGDILNNRYEMTAKLGCGSSSTVWLGRDRYRYVSRLSGTTSLTFSQAALAVQPLCRCEGQYLRFCRRRRGGARAQHLSVYRASKSTT